MTLQSECRQCGGHIEFEAENFTPGTTIDCPHCQQVTALEPQRARKTRATSHSQRPWWVWVIFWLVLAVTIPVAGFFLLAMVVAAVQEPELQGTMLILMVLAATILALWWAVFPIIVAVQLGRLITLNRKLLEKHGDK